MHDDYDHLRESADAAAAVKPCGCGPLVTCAQHGWNETPIEIERRAQRITSRPDGSLVDDAAMDRFVAR